MQESFMGGFYSFMESVTRFLYVNILWIGFSLLGLILFGFFPATTAMFTVVRKWIVKGTDIPIFTTFWKTYKTEFIKSNILGLILCIIGYILYLDLSIVRDTENSLIHLAYYPLLLVILIYALSVLYVFPVFVHFETKFLYVLRNALLITITHPLLTFLMGITVVIVYIITFFVPILILLFAGSITAFILMWYSNFAFIKVQQKKQTADANLVVQK